MAASFGITSTVTAADGTTSWGFLQNVTITKNTETAEARDADGDVAAFDNYNGTEDLSAEFVYSTTGTAPAIGDKIKADSVNWNLTGITLTETNTDYKKCSITAKRYVANTLPTT
jgi:hypothetical protein